MKRTSFILLGATLLLSLGFTTNNAPVSKIYVFGDLLIRSNTTAGRIEFFDLRRPSLLPKLATIVVHDNSDVAVVDNIMYADAGKDLILFDISDIANVRAIDTIHSVFTQMRGRMFENELWVEDGVTSTGMSGCGGCMETPVAVDAPANMESGSSGSLARFAVSNGYLYCIDNSNVIVFDITQTRRPQMKNSVYVNWEIETLFPYKNTLFVGGQRGVYLVDITDGDTPTPLSEFEHGRGCDPVVVEDNRAYVTLRSGTRCGDIEDQLHILDVSNLRSPRLLKSFDVASPYGLAVRDGIVYLCDGPAGLKVIDTRDVNNPQVVAQITNIEPYDVILLEQHMVVTTRDRAIVYELASKVPGALGSISLLE
ncbi:MAG: hypothetical protein H7X80_04585 [bacterium]|nr:hypothetical protein [Candidatus Kapabacteria bacterium]